MKVKLTAAVKRKHHQFSKLQPTHTDMVNNHINNIINN